MARYSQQKPPLGAEIDWSHPLTRGLIAAFIGRELGGGSVYDPVSGLMLVSQTAAGFGTVAGISGPKCDANGKGFRALLALSQRPANTVSLLWRGVHLGTPAINTTLAAANYNSPAASPWVCYALAYDSTNQIVCQFNSNGGFSGLTSGLGAAVGLVTEWAFTAKANDTRVYKNGRLVNSSTIVGPNPILYTATSHFDIGQDGGSSNANHVTDVAYAWNRILSADEMLWLQDEPYAFFRTQARERRYKTVAASILIPPGPFPIVTH